MKETDVMKVGAELLAKRADEKRCSIVMRSQIDKSQVKREYVGKHRKGNCDWNSLSWVV